MRNTPRVIHSHGGCTRSALHSWFACSPHEKKTNLCSSTEAVCRKQDEARCHEDAGETTWIYSLASVWFMMRLKKTKTDGIRHLHCFHPQCKKSSWSSLVVSCNNFLCMVDEKKRKKKRKKQKLGDQPHPSRACKLLTLLLFPVTSWSRINLSVREEPGSAAWDQGSSPSLYRMTHPIPPDRFAVRGWAPPRDCRCNKRDGDESLSDTLLKSVYCLSNSPRSGSSVRESGRLKWNVKING